MFRWWLLGASVSLAVVRRPALEALRGVGGAEQPVRVSPAGKAIVSMDADSVTLRPGELLVKPTGTRPTVDRSGPIAHYDLALRIIAPTTTKSVAQVSVAVQLQALRVYPGADEFAGQILVGLDDSVSRNGSESLASPVDVQIRALEAGVHVEPNQFQLLHTNIPFDSVVVHGPMAANDTVHLLIRASVDTGQTFALYLDRPAISLDASPLSMAGFGFEKARLTVGLPYTTAHDSFIITLAGHRSRPVLTSVSAAPNRPASTDIQSSGLGIDTVEARGGPFKAGKVQLRYTFPYLFLLFTLTGGACGGAIKAIAEQDKKTLTPRAVSLGLGIGVLIGLIVAAAGAIGINLTSLSLPTQFSDAAAFVFAAIGAIGGISVLQEKQ